MSLLGKSDVDHLENKGVGDQLYLKNKGVGIQLYLITKESGFNYNIYDQETIAYLLEALFIPL